MRCVQPYYVQPPAQVSDTQITALSFSGHSPDLLLLHLLLAGGREGGWGWGEVFKLRSAVLGGECHCQCLDRN